MKDLHVLKHSALVAAEVIHQVRHAVGTGDCLYLVPQLDFWWKKNWTRKSLFYSVTTHRTQGSEPLRAG